MYCPTYFPESEEGSITHLAKYLIERLGSPSVKPRPLALEKPTLSQIHHLNMPAYHRITYKYQDRTASKVIFAYNIKWKEGLYYSNHMSDMGAQFALPDDERLFIAHDDILAIEPARLFQGHCDQ